MVLLRESYNRKGGPSAALRKKVNDAGISIVDGSIPLETRRIKRRRSVSIMDWDEYEAFDPGVDRPLHELSRGEAKAAFDRLMAAKGDRISFLRRLVHANGVDLDAPDGIRLLNEWFVSSVEPHGTQSGRLRTFGTRWSMT